MIVVVSPPDDPHAAAVLRELGALGVEATTIDLAAFPRAAALALAYESGRATRVLLRHGGRELDLGAATTIWWHRPRPLAPDSALDEASWRFAYQESCSALTGACGAIPARFVNDPVRQEVADRKTLQLAEAGAVGLAVPRTVVTNDPDRARAFLDGCPRRDGLPDAVVKSLTSTAEVWRETRRVREAELEALAAVRFAPVVFQEYVDGVDVRATVVGRRVYAMEVDARRTRYAPDCRVDWELGRRIARAAEVPRHVERRLLALVDRLGLAYAAVDLRRRDDGEHVFLEVNPAGLWLYAEEAAGLPITAAVARLLAGPRRRAARLTPPSARSIRASRRAAPASAASSPPGRIR